MFAFSRDLLRACRTSCVARTLAIAFVASGAQAHVTLDAPNGGETLIGGSIFPVEWHPDPAHDTERWALWYSTESASGPWNVIDLDIELGDPSTGSIHLYDWTVPDMDDSDVWVRVMQDNVGEDYFDVSDASFQITAAAPTGDFNGDGMVDAVDYTLWRDGLGTTYDVSDYLAWRDNFGSSIPGAVAEIAPTPEPTNLLALSWVFVGLAMAMRRRKGWSNCVR
ncbi:MAG: hypothetical protein AAGF31_01705 [Planctomycetota bacterium]